MNKVLICGITGSVGYKVFELLQKCSDVEIAGGTYLNNHALIENIKPQIPQAILFSPQYPNKIKNFEELIKITKPNLIINCLFGIPGLEVSKLAMDNKINLALANKETLVMAGQFINEYKKNNPQWKFCVIDSEHCALFELLKNNKRQVKQLCITASGGPFLYLNKTERYYKNFHETIQHPNWKMGYKISVDSATMINKFFELVEAGYLFDNIPIKAIFHPQSLIHAMVEYDDNSIMVSLSNPDMKLAICQALSQFGIKINYQANELQFDNLVMNLNEINLNEYKPINWANECLATKNKAIPVIVNVADDFLIEKFKNGKIYFGQIIEIIESYIQKYKDTIIGTWADIYKLKSIIEEDLEYEFRNKRTK